jgi:hypothetical protein
MCEPALTKLMSTFPLPGFTGVVAVPRIDAVAAPKFVRSKDTPLTR